MDDGALETQAVEWMLAVQRGDRAAFHHIYTAYRTQIVRFCTRMLRDPDRGEEAAQEAFVDLYRARQRYRPTGSFRSYLFTLAANRCRKELRRHREVRLPEDWEESDPVHTPEAQAITRELREALSRAYAGLPEKQQLALALIQEEGLSYEEAAQSLNASLGAVKTWVFRARKALKAIVEEYE